MHSIFQKQKALCSFTKTAQCFCFLECVQLIYCRFTVCFRSVSSLMKSRLVTSMSTGEVVS